VYHCVNANKHELILMKNDNEQPVSRDAAASSTVAEVVERWKAPIDKFMSELYAARFPDDVTPLAMKVQTISFVVRIEGSGGRQSGWFPELRMPSDTTAQSPATGTRSNKRLRGPRR
jgi:hypothetical protein